MIYSDIRRPRGQRVEEGFVTLFIAIAMLTMIAKAQNASDIPQQAGRSERVGEFVNSGWTEYEKVLSKAISIRAQKLEEKTGFRFDRNWMPNVSLEWSLGTGVNGFNGMYKAETQTIYFPIRVVYELTARHKQSWSSLNADTVAQDDELAELLDHELGHELMDQVSRRNGLGPWFTEDRFARSSAGEKLGLDILSEGTALFFQRLNSRRDESDLSPQAFPATWEEQRFYPYRMVAYEGGYWIVRDVLNQYGERGLIWLMRHPFVARDDMRTAAVTYRDLALRELSKKNELERTGGALD
jgi:hypothetical protein